MAGQRKTSPIVLGDVALDTRMPLKTNLKILTLIHWNWLNSRSEISAFAKNNLAVPPEQFDRWYRQADWGAMAGRLCRAYLMEDRTDELEGLVEPIDFSVLEQARAHGKGVMLATAHTSATIPGFRGLLSEYQGLLLTTAAPYWSQRLDSTNTNTIFLGDSQNSSDYRENMENHLLQNNGIVASNCDGANGKRSISVNFLGQEIAMYTGFAAMARKLGTPTLWAKMTWSEVNKVSVSFEKIVVDDALDDESWIRSWCGIYLEKLADQIKTAPYDIGFTSGVWRADRGGLKWRVRSKRVTNN